MIKIRDLRRKQFFMVDDEYLNGYAKLCGINATGVYLSLCRHSNKEQTCFPSKKLIAEELAISERSVYTAIKKLEEWNIITIEDQGRKPDGSFKNHIYILQDKTEWKFKPSANSAVGKQCHRQEMQIPSANGAVNRRQHVPNKETHIEGNTYKETHIGEQSSQDKKQYKEIFDLFYKSINPNIQWNNKTQQNAADWMVKKYGLEKMIAITQYAISVQGIKYAPVITTPLQLRDKMAQLIIHKQSKKRRVADMTQDIN